MRGQRKWLVPNSEVEEIRFWKKRFSFLTQKPSKRPKAQFPGTFYETEWFNLQTRYDLGSWGVQHIPTFSYKWKPHVCRFHHDGVITKGHGTGWHFWNIKLSYTKNLKQFVLPILSPENKQVLINFLTLLRLRLLSPWTLFLRCTEADWSF